MTALLDEVDVLLSAAGPETRGWWPRACIWLLRLELEAALMDYWSRTLPEVAETPARIKLLLLDGRLPRETVQRIRASWANLSRAGHRHAYEMAPTVAELRSWHGEVAILSQLLAERQQAD